MRLAALNALDDDAAAAAFLRCCGSTQWAQEMAAARPFVNADQMTARADAIWSGLDPSDWLEAFAAHPRIGERPPDASRWSTEEQAGVAVEEQTQRTLDEANRSYEARFGYIFIVCATGKTAPEMLALLERRLRHDADDELTIAAEEQRKITRLRLNKLLAEEPDTR
jgi:OHCU decarboxylase